MRKSEALGGMGQFGVMHLGESFTLGLWLHPTVKSCLELGFGWPGYCGSFWNRFNNCSETAKTRALKLDISPKKSEVVVGASLFLINTIQQLNWFLHCLLHELPMQPILRLEFLLENGLFLTK